VKLASLVALVACAVPALSAAADPFPIISTDELKRRLDAKEDFVLANALSPIEHAEESILGSVNVPYSGLRDGKAKLPTDKAKPIVFYCKGPKCTKSVKAAGLAARMGYTNLAVYNEGLPEWVKRGYPATSRKVYPAVEIPAVSAAELKRMLEAKQDVFLLDIRDEDDVRAGGIPGARNIDLEVLDARLAEVPKGRRIVLVDLHGKQTQIAGRFLASKGYADVVRLDGGYVGGWLKGGFAAAR
jgi:rhodanese-related sulfurtransferase